MSYSKCPASVGVVTNLQKRHYAESSEHCKHPHEAHTVWKDYSNDLFIVQDAKMQAIHTGQDRKIVVW